MTFWILLVFRDPSKNRLLSEDDDSWGSWGAGDWHPGENSSSSGSSGKLRSPTSEFDPDSSSPATTAAAQKKKEMNDLERWLNDSSLDTDSPKSKSKKTPSKKSDFNSDWDDWQMGSAQGSPMSTNTASSTHSSLSGSKKKVSPKPQQNNANKNRMGWDDVPGWNEDFTGKQKEPLVGNLVDLSSDSNQVQEESGWDNEVWAQESDEEWQCLESGQPNTSKLKWWTKVDGDKNNYSDVTCMHLLPNTSVLLDDYYNGQNIYIYNICMRSDFWSLS